MIREAPSERCEGEAAGNGEQRDEWQERRVVIGACWCCRWRERTCFSCERSAMAGEACGSQSCRAEFSCAVVLELELELKLLQIDGLKGTSEADGLVLNINQRLAFVAWVVAVW